MKPISDCHLDDDLVVDVCGFRERDFQFSRSLLIVHDCRELEIKTLWFQFVCYSVSLDCPAATSIHVYKLWPSPSRFDAKERILLLLCPPPFWGKCHGDDTVPAVPDFIYPVEKIFQSPIDSTFLADFNVQSELQKCDIVKANVMRVHAILQSQLGNIRRQSVFVLSLLLWSSHLQC